MAKKKQTEETEVLELATDHVVTVHDVIRSGKGVTQVSKVSNDPEIAALQSANEKLEKENEDLKAKVAELEETVSELDTAVATLEADKADKGGT